MADKEQNVGMTQEERVLRGAKEIAAHMGVSPATIVRWRRRFRGREEVRLCFPAFLMATGRGYGLRLCSNTALIRQWMERWQQIDCVEAQEKARWRRRTPRMKRLGETSKKLEGRSEGGDEKATREEGLNRPTNTDPPKLDITLSETPVDTAITAIVEVGLPSTTQPHQALTRPLDCTCGTATPCQAHH